jgi:hypothetical protein
MNAPAPIIRGIADAMLERAFSAEYIKLDSAQHSAVLTDFVQACADDTGMSVSEYKRCIGDGNLASYANSLLAVRQYGEQHENC